MKLRKAIRKSTRVYIDVRCNGVSHLLQASKKEVKEMLYESGYLDADLDEWSGDEGFSVTWRRVEGEDWLVLQFTQGTK